MFIFESYRNYMRLIVILILWPLLSMAQWNPDAGLVHSYTDEAEIIVSSGANKHHITDGSPHSFWESANPMPDRYLKRPDLNILFGAKKFHITPRVQGYSMAFDGDGDTKTDFSAGTYELIFNHLTAVKFISIKMQTTDAVEMEVKGRDTVLHLSFDRNTNFQQISHSLGSVRQVNSILISCRSSFSIFELAALGDAPLEYVIFDLKREVPVGWISSRHLNGPDIRRISIYWSNDASTWSLITNPLPSAIPELPIIINPPISARYIKYEFELTDAPYQKAKLWEVKIYGPNGPFLPPPKAVPAKHTYGDSFGLNTFWGWGYSVFSDLLNETQGQHKFKVLTKRVRNYHRLDWDIRTPDSLPDYHEMAKGKGTASNWWMNWDREYAAWMDAGLLIDASITFKNNLFMDTLWHHPEGQARAYGKNFAQYFGSGRKLVNLIEVGNEPWNYNPGVYQNILKGMSKGIKEAAPKLSVIPCAVQAYAPHDDNNNYISTYLTSWNTQQIDGVNSHIYAYTYNSEGNRIAVNPEDRRSEVWSVSNLKKYVTQNMGAKDIYVTEFGYDSEGAGDDCTHSECVTELEQAIYGARMSLILYRLGVSQFYWYYFTNVAYDSFLHNRSGLTSPYGKGFKEKASFFAFKTLFETLGDQYFHAILQEDEQAYIYSFSDSSGRISSIVAWRPSSRDHLLTKWIRIPFEGSVQAVSPLILSAYSPQYKVEGRFLWVQLSGVPVIIEIND